MTTPKIGDPDPTIGLGGCRAERLKEGRYRYICTRARGHQDDVPGTDHVAGTGTEVAGVWPLQAASAETYTYSQPLTIALIDSEQLPVVQREVVRALAEVSDLLDSVGIAHRLALTDHSLVAAPTLLDVATAEWPETEEYRA
jgi:hypothetical protein